MSRFLALFAAAALGSWSQSCGGDPAEDPSATHAAPNASSATIGEHGEVTLHVDRELVARMGLATSELAEHAFVPERTAYGRAIDDDARAFTLRAPVAGTLRASADAPWPERGTSIAAGAVVATLEPRWTPQERGDAAARLASARADLAALSSALPAQRSALARTKALNEADKTASDRALEEARAAVETQEARIAGAEELVRALEALQDPSKSGRAGIALSAERGGEIIEVLGRPGEFVDAGAAVLRVEDFSHPLVRIDLPLDGGAPATAKTARIEPIGADVEPAEADIIGLDATSDALPRGIALLARLRDAGSPAARLLRPGQAIVARIATSAAPRSGVLVPDSAVIRLAGKAWVYVARGEEEFVRAELDLSAPRPGGWFSDAAWARPGARVVVGGAQQLASHELFDLTASGASGADE